MTMIFPAPPAVTVPIQGSADVFPVRRIFCVGKNYADHAREMGGDPNREPPFFFGKDASTLALSGATIPYPGLTANLHHEIELVVALHVGGVDIESANALDHVYGYAVGNDLTRRDLQAAAKAAGQPWDTAKAFDQAAVISPLNPATMIGHRQTGRIWLAVNGIVRQEGDIGAMIWPVPEIIASLSRLFTLHPGDLIYTGTPAGVGPLVVGDKVEGGIEGVGTLTHLIG